MGKEKKISDMSVTYINEAPPPYERSETKALIINDSSFTADNPVFMVEPQDNNSASLRRLCRGLLLILLSGVLLGVVLYFCLYGFRRTTKDTNIYIHNEIKITLPININIPQTNAVLEEEIQTQAQPGRLTAMLNQTAEQDDIRETTTTNGVIAEVFVDSQSSGQYCLDYFNCFHFEISEGAKTWHEAYRYCREKDMFLPGRDIYFELRYGGKFPAFMKDNAANGLWSSGKVEHGHYQFLDAKPGFSVSLFSPTIRGYECVKFVNDANNLTTFTVANCRDNAMAICISPASYYINRGQLSQHKRPTVTVKEVFKGNSSELEDGQDLQSLKVFHRAVERQSKNATFPVLFLPLLLDVLEVQEENAEDVKLECSNVPEDRVIWTKDGVFFRNGVRDTPLYHAPHVSSGPTTLQGSYGCEMWEPGKTKKIPSSNKIYVGYKDTLLVTAVIKKQDINPLAISCSRNPFGCDESISGNCCWYWNIAERIKHEFEEPTSWYSVDETVTLMDDFTLKSRVTINFFVYRWNLQYVNWSNMNDPEIIVMTVMDPHETLQRSKN